MEVDNDSSDSDGYGYGNNQEAIVNPIRRRNDQAAPAEVEGFSTDNGVTMINFAKSKQVVCDKCSVSLKSMTKAAMDTWNVKSWSVHLCTKAKEKRLKRRKKSRYF